MWAIHPLKTMRDRASPGDSPPGVAPTTERKYLSGRYTSAEEQVEERVSLGAGPLLPGDGK